MTKKLCFSAFVFGAYQKYIPYYIYCIHRTYPNDYIKVFYNGSLDKKIKILLSEYSETKKSAFEIIELRDDNFEKFNDYKIKGGGKKLLRWLIDEHYFNRFEYVYFGDVDILILPEKTNLLDFHVEQLNKFKLPFSNKIRTNENGNPVKRLTGLHFIKTEEYYASLSQLIQKVKTDKAFRENYLSDVERDENLLYKLNKDAFNFDDTLLTKAQRPWHGLHLGITRGNKNVNLKTIQDNSSLSIEEIKIQLNSMLQDKVFQKIIKEVFVIELYVILKNLDIGVPVGWKIKAFNYKLNEYKKDFKRMLKLIITPKRRTTNENIIRK